MSGMLLLLPLSIALGATFALLFLRAAKDGQFDHLDEEGERVIEDDIG